ncbi:hypothetical protein [Leucobacter sp. cx-169]|uniref:hypothetical protein n=1 Tax=Leucobacter sp. cx-169 TaxID=2770549 RepID=UPI00165E4F96|nr:hypothetical protein [Leucobacter sp. cx-169]MBC9927371.1 hypothetical protein [Leucobacter sp. cx-169]
MSTQRQAAGAVKAGDKIGGQWAALERAESVAPPISGSAAPTVSQEQLQSIRDRAAKTREAAAAIARQETRLLHAELAATLLSAHPEARSMIIGRNLGGSYDEDTWGFAGAEDESGVQIAIDPEMHESLSNLVFESTAEVGVNVDTAGERYQDEYEEVGGVDVLEALKGAEQDDNVLLDYDDGGQVDDVLTKIWTDGVSNGTIAGAIRTEADAISDLRERLSIEYSIDAVDDEMLQTLAGDVLSRHGASQLDWDQAECASYFRAIDLEVGNFADHRASE